VDHEDWDRRYADSELLWTAQPNRFLADEVAQLPAGRALDVACGEGRNAVWLAEHGWEVTGVDFSEVGLAKAAKLAGERGVSVEWVLGDVREDLLPSETFDLVAVLYLHLPAAERHQVLARAASALAPGGLVLVVGHDLTNLTEGYGGPQDPAILFTPDDVAADLSQLRIERAQRVHRPVSSPEGEVVAIDALILAQRDPSAV